MPRFDGAVFTTPPPPLGAARQFNELHEVLKWLLAIPRPVLLSATFFAPRKDSPSQDLVSPEVLEFGIWNLSCGSAALGKLQVSDGVAPHFRAARACPAGAGLPLGALI